MKHETYGLGIDLGGSSIKAVAVTPAGELLSRHNIEFDPAQNMEWAEKIRALVRHLQHECGDPADGIGLSAPGLAAAVCSFINILDPEAVIIGGGIARAGTALFGPLQEFLEPIEWRPIGQRTRIISAQLGEFAGAIGAASSGLKEGR